MHTYIHTYRRTYIHIYMYVYIVQQIYLRVCVYVRLCAPVHVYHAFVPFSMVVLILTAVFGSEQGSAAESPSRRCEIGKSPLS